MSIFNKVIHIQKVLNSLYPNPPVPLNSKDTFTFLVAVVLSAQTTDGKVNEVTKDLFELAPTPEAMSRLSPTDVEKIIRQVGLAPRKSLHIVELSKLLVSKFNGIVPSNYEDLESLPGVGHKTASVVMSQAFGEPAIAVDTHVHRLALRWGLSKENNVDKVQKDLMKHFPIEDWNKVGEILFYVETICLI
jgi:endonuclease-3